MRHVSLRAIIHELQEHGMYARVIRQFRMEGRRHHSSLPHQHRVIPTLGKNFHALSDSLDERRSDEYHLQRLATQSAGGCDDCGIDLPSIGVAADCDVDCVETRLMRVLYVPGQHDRARTGAEGWLAVHELVQLLEALLTK